jgi:hypothetical protein
MEGNLFSFICILARPRDDNYREGGIYSFGFKPEKKGLYIPIEMEREK